MNAGSISLAALQERLASSHAFADVALADLAPLPTTGLAHDHVRIRGRGLMLRIPKQSQMALDAVANLAYQAACFRRASAGGHAPRLYAILSPEPDLPMGALVVEAIDGRPASLPRDLAAIAEALASIHALTVPAAAARPPLRDAADPVAETLAEVRRQGAFLPRAGLARDARAAIEAELAWAEGFADRAERPPVTLISFDAHPGNFLVRDDGRAVLVDLEKARYGAAGFDLAHATLYTSTTWDVTCRAVLDAQAVAAFYRDWLDRAPAALAAESRPWLLPLRRLMWLWSVTWCAKWRVRSQVAATTGKHARAETEDWSAELSDAALVAHVAERVAHYLEPETICRVRSDWLGRNALTELLVS